MDHVRYFSKQLITLINETLMHDLRLADATSISVTTMLGSEKRVAIDLSITRAHRLAIYTVRTSGPFQRSRVSCPRIVCV